MDLEIGIGIYWDWDYYWDWDLISKLFGTFLFGWMDG